MLLLPLILRNSCKMKQYEPMQKDFNGKVELWLIIYY